MPDYSFSAWLPPARTVSVVPVPTLAHPLEHVEGIPSATLVVVLSPARQTNQTASSADKKHRIERAGPTRKKKKNIVREKRRNGKCDEDERGNGNVGFIRVGVRGRGVLGGGG